MPLAALARMAVLALGLAIPSGLAQAQSPIVLVTDQEAL